MAEVKVKKKKAVRQVGEGRVYIYTSFNNTVVTLTDNNGNVLSWSSAGTVGFTGPKKSTPYAASVVVKDLAGKAAPYGVRLVRVYVQGVGGGREAAVRALNANGFLVQSIKDLTPIPHNGCRRPRPRRV
jgi:small subunit ribosomal protein S11